MTGVIDFGDANWGDPDYDFMYLFVDFGLAFVEDVARRYGHPNLTRLRNKVRYFGIVDQIDTILEDEGRALNGQKEKAWLRLEQLLDLVQADRLLAHGVWSSLERPRRPRPLSRSAGTGAAKDHCH